MTPGWEAPWASLDPSSSPSWTSPPKPGGRQVASWASWPGRATRVWKLSRTPLQRRDENRMAWPSSSFRSRLTSAGTNPNPGTRRYSGWLHFTDVMLTLVESEGTPASSQRFWGALTVLLESFLLESYFYRTKCLRMHPSNWHYHSHIVPIFTCFHPGLQ